MRIEQIMNQPVITCRPSESLNSAAALMWENDCGALPVVDDTGVVIGMITDRDICMAAYTSGGELSALLVGGTMSSHVFTCLAKQPLTDAERTMAHAQVLRLPVVDSYGRAIGIVSLNDIARAASLDSTRITKETVATLAAISAPRRVTALERTV